MGRVLASSRLEDIQPHTATYSNMDLVKQVTAGTGKNTNPDVEVEYVLIGAGLPRTGTASTCTAIENLLPGRCHHMQVAIEGKQNAVFWLKAGRGEVREEDVYQVRRSFCLRRLSNVTLLEGPDGDVSKCKGPADRKRPCQVVYVCQELYQTNQKLCNRFLGVSTYETTVQNSWEDNESGTVHCQCTHLSWRKVPAGNVWCHRCW